MAADTWLAFVAASAVVLIIPGPTILTVTRMLAAGARAPVFEEVKAESGRKLFANMFAVTALNPKGIVFYVVFVPRFIDQQADLRMQLAVLALTFVTLATANAALYTVFASRARGLLASAAARRGFNVLGGSLLSGAGIWALVSRRSA